MTANLLDPMEAASEEGALLVAATLLQKEERVTPLHSHSRGQLFGAMSGLLSVQAADSQWVIPAIHAVWIPPDCPHALRSHGAFSGWSAYVVRSACNSLPHTPCAIRTSGLLREAVARAATWKKASLDPAQTRLAQVILDEVRTLRHEPLGLPMPQEPRLLRIATALADDLAIDRGLNDWAKWGGLTPRTLSRHFVAQTGFTLAEWRQRARILRALEMLSTGRSVTEVALSLGYDSVSGFISMFKRIMKTTPTGYFAGEGAAAGLWRA